MLELLGHGEAGKLLLLDKRHVVGGNALGDAHGKQGLLVIRVDLEHRVRAGFDIMDGAHELLAVDGIGVELLLFLGDLLVVGQELALQDAEPVEFVEQIGGGAKRVRQGILGAGGNVAVQDLVGSNVVLVVHALERGIDRVGFRGAEGGNTEDCGKGLDSQNKTPCFQLLVNFTVIGGVAPQL